MADKVPTNQFDDFFEQMDQTTRFYQRAVMFLAAERIAEVQDALDPQIIKMAPQKPSLRQRAGNVAHNLLRRFTPRAAKKSARKGSEKSGDVEAVVIDVSPLPWPLDQPPSIADDVESFPLIVHPIDEKKGDRSHE